MKKKWLITTAVLLIFMMISGCQASADNTGSSAAVSGDTLYGQVTAIDGSSITLALGTMQVISGTGDRPDGSQDGQRTPPDGAQGGQGTPPSGQSGQGTPPDRQSGSSDGQGDSADGQADATSSATASAGNNGGGFGGGQPGGLELTGEELTITVADSTEIKLQGMGESTTGSLSDIEVGSILSVTMSGNTVTSITVMQFGGIGGIPDRASDSPTNGGGSPIDTATTTGASNT